MGSISVEFGTRFVMVDGKQIKLQIWDTVSWIYMYIVPYCPSTEYHFSH
jgi:hypothetical protein